MCVWSGVGVEKGWGGVPSLETQILRFDLSSAWFLWRSSSIPGLRSKAKLGSVSAPALTLCYCAHAS